MTAPIECPECHGDGVQWDPENGTWPCPLCDGWGVVDPRESDEDRAEREREWREER